jgi:hypothetical protein
MTKQDRQKLSILIVLLGVLGVTMGLAYRMNQPQTTAAVHAAEAKTPAANPPAQNDAARLRLDLIEKSEEAGGDIAKRNLFQYQQTPPPQTFSGRGSSPPTLSPSPPPTVTIPIARPSGPPPPPPITLKYQGFANTTTPTPGLTAFIGDDSRHYNVTVGEILMGRFRIANITDKAVEIEDLEYNRRQTLPLIK